MSSKRIIVKEPKIAVKLFSEAGPWSLVWLAVRVYVGWEWLSAGWGKLAGTSWGPATLHAFWAKAVAIPETGHPAIAYDWYRAFLQAMLDAKAETWMSSVVAWGELLIGVALILGAFVGITALFGAFMNMNFMLAGSASTNPVLLLLAILLILAWKTAGWWGLDRWLLPIIGTPWSRVDLQEDGKS